jgi:chemotaxis protein CheD
MVHIIGIAGYKVSNNSEDILVTYSLGSCIGVTIYDPVANVGGMIHTMLPDSQIDRMKAKLNPLMFADLGVPILLQEAFDYGAKRTNLIVKIAGGAYMLDGNEFFKIGHRNHTIVRKIMWKNNILISGEDVGGSHPRTMYLNMQNGTTIIKAQGSEFEL